MLTNNPHFLKTQALDLNLGEALRTRAFDE